MVLKTWECLPHPKRNGQYCDLEMLSKASTFHCCGNMWPGKRLILFLNTQSTDINNYRSSVHTFQELKHC